MGKKSGKFIKRLLAAWLAAALIIVPEAGQLSSGVFASTDKYPNVFTFTVTDGEKAIEGADITITASSSEDGPYTGVTDSDGVAPIQSLTDIIAKSELGAEIEVTVIKAGYQNYSSSYSLTDQYGNIDIVMTKIPPVTISGTVKEAGTGNPMEGAVVEITGYENFSAVTSSDGTYSIDGLYENQTYTINVSHDGFAVSSKNVIFGSNNDFALKKLNTGLTFSDSNPVPIVYNPDNIHYNNAASGNLGIGAITYQITEGDAAIIDAVTGELTIQKAGTITVTAIQAEDEIYSSASASYSLTINKAPQPKFSFETSEPDDIEVTKSNYTNTASGGREDGEITYEITEGDAATIDALTGTLTFLKAGTVTVRATKAGNDKYEDAVATYHLSIVKLHQKNFKFLIPDPSDIVYHSNATYTNTAAGGQSEGAITYNIKSGDAAEINEETGELTLLKAGTVTVMATLEGNDIYEPATAQYSIVIQRADQEKLAFEIPSPSNLVYRDNLKYTNTAIGGSGEGIITYEIINGDAASINETTGELTIHKSGTVTVKAIKEEDSQYKAASVTYTVTIDKAYQSSFAFMTTSPEDIKITDRTYTNTVTGIQSSGSLTYKIISGDAAIINPDTGKLTFRKIGTITVQAILEGDSRYHGASATYNLTIKKAKQSQFAFTTSFPSAITYNEHGIYSNKATGGQSGGRITYEITDGHAVNINPYTGDLALIKSGTVTVMATLEGNDDYDPITTSYTLTINKAEQTGFSFNDPSPINITYGIGKTYMNAAFGGQSNGNITYELTDGLGAAQIDAHTGRLTTVKSGTIVIKATLEGNECYKPAYTSYTITINKADQTGFEFANQHPSNIVYDSINNTYTNTASGGQSGKAVSYYRTQGDAASVDAVTGELTIHKSGTVTIKAELPSDDCYNTAYTFYSLTIEKAEQKGFVFQTPTPTNITYNSNNNQFTNTAAGGQSGKKVSYAVMKGSSATVNRDTGLLTVWKAGTVTVTADLPGDDCYQDVQASYTITIDKDNQLIQFEKTGTQGMPISIIYGNEFSNAAYEVKDESDADKTGHGIKKITYAIVSDVNGVVKDISDSGVLTFNDSKVGDVVIKAVKPEDDCYNSTETTYYLKVNYLEAPQEPYQLSGDTLNTEGWYTGDVTITAKECYEISYSNALTGNTWSDHLTVDSEGVNAKTIYLRKACANGYDITGDINIDGEDIKIDKSNPTDLEISYSKSVMDTVLETITFGFYNSSATVTLTAKDDYSGINEFEWTYSQQIGSSTANNVVSEMNKIQASDITYSDQTATASFTLTPDETKQYRGSIHFKATDKAGRSSEKYDDKVTVIDTIAPSVNITYSGELVQKVDSLNQTVLAVDDTTRFIYRGEITATIEVNEANFFEGYQAGEILNHDMKITVKRDGNIVSDYKMTDWEHEDGTDKYISKITLKTDGNYVIEVMYQDKSSNQMQYQSEGENKKGTSGYTSNVLTIDTVAPVINVTYQNKNNDSKSNYYSSGRKATIQITDRNLRPSEVHTLVTAKDVQGNVLSGSGINSMGGVSSWTQVSPNVWQATVTYEEDAVYYFDIDCKDMANNSAPDYRGDSFIVDKTGPSYSSLSLTYSTPQMEKIIQAITFGYYKPSVTVTLKAEDRISGVDSFTWNYRQEEGTSTTKNVLTESNTIKNDKIDYSNRNLTATASFTLTADEAKQYRGNISFTATDRAGNSSSQKLDDKKVVVDTISPTRIVELSPAQQVADKNTLLTRNSYQYTEEGTNSILYYNQNVKATFKITEANFYAEDVNIYVNDTVVIPDDWKQNGDEWTGTITLSGDGDYIISMNYMDRSTNVMKTYQSEEIVIDTIKPKINVKYSPNHIRKETKDKRKYYNAAQTATISVTEHNFRADDIQAVVTAKDVKGKDVDVIDYSDYLKTRSNWSKNGDVYTSQIPFSMDANYTFDISYKDMALNSANDYEKDLFTVDTTAPNKLDVSYSKNLFETIMNAVTFGYYNDRMTVTIKAEDKISGVNNFVYHYIRSEGVSEVNAQQLNAAIKNAKITYSDQGEVATATFSIPGTLLRSNNQFNGTIKFTAADHSGNSTEKSGKERIIVDNIAPTASVSYNKPVQKLDGISYYSGNINAAITVNEANFYPEDVTMTVSKNGGKAYEVKPSWSDANADVHTGSYRMEGDGDYIVNIAYKDRSNNKMSSYTSNQFTIDTEKPKIKVDNIADASANKDKKIGFLISTKDKNLDASKFLPKLTSIEMDKNGSFSKINVPTGNLRTITAGQEYAYIVDNLAADGIYSLSCIVTDKAGNWADEMAVTKSANSETSKLSFSVNRKGSTYALDHNTNRVVKDYYVQKVDDNIVIEETNVNPLQSYQLTMNGNNLSEGKDYTIKQTGGKGQWYQYTYTVKPSLFQKEGEYTIISTSVDKAKNKAYSDIKNAEISFVVDKTPPVVTISGLNNKGRYQTKTQKVTVIPKDDGGKLDSLEVMVTSKNGRKITDETGRDISERINLSGNKLLEALEKNSNKINFEIPTGMDMNVQIVCNDLSVDDKGRRNTTEEVFKNVTVSPDWYIIFYANKPLFYSTVAGALFLLISISSFAIVRKRRR